MSITELEGVWPWDRWGQESKAEERVSRTKQLTARASAAIFVPTERVLAGRPVAGLTGARLQNNDSGINEQWGNTVDRGRCA